MTEFLLATDSVHTSAAACDYLEDRLRDDDVVAVLSVREAGAHPRDAGDALNVATVRLGALPSVEVTAETREGEAAAAVLDVLGSGGIDEIVVGARGGAPDAPDAPADLGRTTRVILVESTVPVVVLPVDSAYPTASGYG